MSVAPEVDSIVRKAEASPTFTAEEVAALKRMADAWRGLEAFGRVAGFVKACLQWIGWALAAYLAFKAGAIDWIKQVAK